MPIQDLEFFFQLGGLLIILWKAPYLTYRNQTLQINFAGSLFSLISGFFISCFCILTWF